MQSKSILVTTPAFDGGSAAPSVISTNVLSGMPIMRTWNILRSHDLTSDLMAWECTAGQFECRYWQDEVVMIVSGEVFVTDEKGEERRLGPGDVGFFPAGTTSIWRVPERVRKIAVLRETMWRPAGIALKIWKRLLRMVG
jgi:hypothetical protein